MEKIIPTLLCIHGIFFDDLMEIPKIMETFGDNNVQIWGKKALARSVMAFVSSSPWGRQDLTNFLDATTATKFDDEAVNYFKQFLYSLDGDLVSLAKILDEIIEGNGSHLNSLLVGLVTGNTKFD